MLNKLINKGKSVVLLIGFGLAFLHCTKEDNPLTKISNLEKEVKELKESIAQSQSVAPLIQESSTTLKEKSNRVVAIVKTVMPSVVSIHSEKIVAVNPHQYFNPFEDFFGDPHNKKQKKQYKQQGLGSGVIISEEGHILTNHHVAGDADELKVTLSNDQEYEAEVVGSDKLSDVAVIKIKNPPKNLPITEMGDSEKLHVGETVIAIGNPFGYANTVTSGILSATGRRVGINSYENYLQTDASINPGNSGGALVNLDGLLIGINTAIASRTGASHGIGFAIPINMAKKIMEDLIGEGVVTRGYLGVYLQPIDENISEAMGLTSTKGALVSSVIEDSPADKAGFQETDIILKIGDKTIKNVNHLRNVVAMLEAEESYVFTIMREGKEHTLKVKIGVRPDDPQAKSKTIKPKEDFGFSLEALTRNHAYRYNINSKYGLIITNIKIGSAGDKSGFKAGDVILQVNKKKVTDIPKFYELINESNKDIQLVLVERGGSNMYVGLKVK